MRRKASPTAGTAAAWVVLAPSWPPAAPAGRPQSRNRYSYVLNNPIKMIDPSDHCGKENDSDTENASCAWLANAIADYDVFIRDLAGNWTSHELQTVLQAFHLFMAGAHWSPTDFRRAIGGHVDIERTFEASKPPGNTIWAPASISDGNVYSRECGSS
jgi:hypothetical protein